MLEKIKKTWLSGRFFALAVAILVAPAAALAGISAQGISAQGISAQGISAQGISAQGISAQGISAQGISAQGISAQGISAQGISAQGISAQGISAQGVAIMGTDLVAADLKGVDIDSVEIRGTTSDSAPVSVELTANPGMSTGAGSYLALSGGDTAVGHYATAHLVDVNGAAAEDLDLYIAGSRPDPVPNLLHRADNQVNDDVTLYEVYFFNKFAGQWASLCPVHDATGGATAMAIAEDPSNPGKFMFACTATGVAAKCARIWGFRPWRNSTSWFFDDGTGDWVERDYELKPFYDACKVAARASYCQNRDSFTRNGTLVDLFDTRQLIWPNAIENPFGAVDDDSRWMFAQEYFVSFDTLASDPNVHVTALQRTRYRDLTPDAQCGAFSTVDRLEHDNFEDAKWGTPLTNTPRIEVFSPNYCTHHEDVPGEGLPWDCSPCTTAVCRVHPECCSLNPTAPQPAWSPACVAARTTLCRDGAGPVWPVGRVWPDDVVPTPQVDAKYLLGPGGAVEGTNGVSTGSSQATIKGWTCDPEWPGATVKVEIYGGAPREQGGTLLGTVRADQALEQPLAREVAAACDGPNFTTARHGFAFDLLAGTTGNVFVYALDAPTPDGPAAPPTLLRNGIVRVPTCAHSEHATGAALDASCSACATAVCASEALGGCCSTEWTAECAAEAETCAATDTSAGANERAFAQVLTGWIEAPSTGPYTFAATAEPSRVFVNGQKLVDWWDGPGTTSGTITLMQGGKYHLRWDRFQATPPGSPSDQGLTWQPPGAVAQGPIPAAALYRVAPGVGKGLQATYYDAPGFAGPSVGRFEAVDLPNDPTKLPAGITAPYSAIWDGEITPLYTEDYTFTVVAAGNATLEIAGATLAPPAPPAPPLAPSCPHDICALGAKLTASTITEEACDPCVDQVCAKDPFCCTGGYLSYYSTEPEWDSKCVGEVATVCGLSCKNPLPTTTTQRRSVGPVALRAGVRYHVRLKLDQTSTTDLRAQLEWNSLRQAREAVPVTAFEPPGPPQNHGAGVNVVSFATKQNGTKPDLDHPRASGAAPDLSLAPPTGANGLPVVPVLAARDDAAAGVPPPPMVVVPRFGAEIQSSATSISVKGLGGVAGGSVLAHVEGTLIDVLMTTDPNGFFGGLIPVGAYGNYTLRLTQRNYPGASCTSPPALFCAESAPVKWDVKLSPVSPTAPAPTITSPRDPTASPNPANDTFLVTGRGNPGAYNVCDLGGGGSALPSTVTAGGNGLINEPVQLTNGSVDPKLGWHKLVFQKAACSSGPGPGSSNPVFVSVGIRPPTVEFPRTGARLACDPNATDLTFVHVKGSIPYRQGQFGRLRIYEETGRNGLELARTDLGVDEQNPLPDGSFGFDGGINLTPGKHLIYFFQAPDAPPNATQDQIDAHFRAFASIADTPTSHITIDVPPPPIAFPFRTNGFQQTSPLKFGRGGCDPQQGQPGPDCALPNADVNVRVGNRVWTTRADAHGDWDITFDLPPGWHQMRISQVADTKAGGSWSEGCPSDNTLVGIVEGNEADRPTLKLPGTITVAAEGPKGTKIDYDASATTVSGKPAELVCTPPSGKIFPVGLTLVFCTAIDPETRAVGLGGFVVNVVDGPPVVKVPKNIVAEATSALGAIVAWNASATDAVSGDLPVECVPASPALFALDEESQVSCTATDGASHPTTEMFSVVVRDTTPPTMCALPDLRILASGPGGGFVKYATCASDLVDGAVPVTCDRPSGSFFPVGKTLVTCTATDRHKNAAPAKQFIVDVGDSTPPVLKLPANIQVVAPSRLGVKVTYTATAKDDVDPAPVVACTPKSGSQFVLGTTTVNCTATDASGNRSTGSFQVRVVIAFGGFLAPINNNGSSVFFRPVPVPVRITLADGSAGIRDLPARLFLARLDTAGRPGPEQPAAGLPPSLGNAFVYNPLLREYDLLLDIHTLAAGPWQLRADLGDGVAHAVRITLR